MAQGYTRLFIHKDGEIIFSKRGSKKDTASEFWTASAAGHVTCPKKYEEAASNEVFEELGIKPDLVMIDKLIVDFGFERETIGIFSGVSEEQPTPNPEEGAEIILLPFQEALTEFRGWNIQSLRRINSKFFTYS